MAVPPKVRVFTSAPAEARSHTKYPRDSHASESP